MGITCLVPGVSRIICSSSTLGTYLGTQWTPVRPEVDLKNYNACRNYVLLHALV